jgi:hypothetical protein
MKLGKTISSGGRLTDFCFDKYADWHFHNFRVNPGHPDIHTFSFDFLL